MLDLCTIRAILVDLKSVEEAVRNETALSLNEALCLCQHEKGNTDPSSLARELSLSPSRMTRILDSLVQKGYIERVTSDEDRRAVTVKMTDSGKSVSEKLHTLDTQLPEYLNDAINQLETATGEI